MSLRVNHPSHHPSVRLVLSVCLYVMFTCTPISFLIIFCNRCPDLVMPALIMTLQWGFECACKHTQCVGPLCVCFMRLLTSLTGRMPSALSVFLHSSMSLKLLYTLYKNILISAMFYCRKITLFFLFISAIALKSCWKANPVFCLCICPRYHTYMCLKILLCVTWKAQSSVVVQHPFCPT